MTVDFKLLAANLGWCFYPLVGTLALTVMAAANYSWKRCFEPELLAGRTAWELRFIHHASGISQLAGMTGTLAGLVMGLGRMTPGDPASIGNLVQALSIAMWTTYLGLIIALSGQMFIWLTTTAKEKAHG